MKPISETFIDVRRLAILREIHERRTVVATAAAVHLTPSAVSQQIAALSRELGVPLLTRRGRGVHLTPQALLLLDHAAVLLRQMERARTELESFNGAEPGPMTIGAFGTAIVNLVAPALMRSKRLPRCVVREVEAPECFGELDTGSLDVVITVDYQEGPCHRNSRYVRRDLLRDPFFAVLPKSHPLAKRRAIPLRKLAEEPWVMGADDGPCGEVAKAACTASGFRPDIQHRVNDYQAAVALVAANAGVSLVPGLALAGSALANVAVRPIAGSAPSRSIYAAVRDGSERSPALAAILDALTAAAMR
ncbi:LysR family transcriptional regulator [Pendulispora brunnea]|uniref:LysR family transcriptional regulator n=1 Tax=Pendulispora brunnea TaxID=2905690 RepID=A0ABZ2KCU2_9BACT